MKKAIYIILIFLLPASFFAQWAIGFGGTSDDAGTSIAVDGIGITYVTGHFEGTVDFDPGGKVFNLTSAGSFDIFIAKYAPDGSFVWANKIGGIGDDAGSCISADGNGNIYVTGGFEGTVDFDPGGSTFNLTSFGGADIFISKYASDGSFIWAKNMGGSSYDAGSSISINETGNTYITGFFEGTADFDPSDGTVALSSAGSIDIFIAKYAIDGSLIWAKSLGSSSDDAGNNISVDDNGNVYVIGFFEGKADFDPGVGTFNLTNAGLYDIFIAKYAADGSFVWAKSVGSPNYDLGRGWVDSSGNIYVTGAFEGTVDFNPGTDIFNLVSAGKSDVFIAKYTTEGSFVWAKNIEGSTDGEGTSLTVDASGNVYITGAFEGTADFDPGTGIFNLTSSGPSDVFIAKYTSEGIFAWAKNLGGDDDDAGFSIAVDGNGNTYVTGYFQGSLNIDLENVMYNLTSVGDYDIFLVKYLSDGTVKVEEDLGSQGEFSLTQNYPNPFNPTTKISYSIPVVVKENFPSLQNVELKIYDVLGKEVATLVNKQQSPGNYNVDFDASRLSSGVYYYQLKTSELMQIRKMMLIK